MHVNGGTVKGSSDYRMWGSDDYAGCFTEGTSTRISDFEISAYATTRKDYKTIMEDSKLNYLGLSPVPSLTYYNPKYVNTKEDHDRFPVDNVSWYDAVYFCNLLSLKEGRDTVYEISDVKLEVEDCNGTSVTHISKATVTQNLKKKGWRLPTEAEWEYAARGGDPRKAEWYYEYAGSKSQWSSVPKSTPAYNDGSDNGIDKVGWYSHNINNGGITAAARAKEGSEGYGPHQVGLKAPNSLKLYDMSGNVEEWCTDEFEQEYSLDKKMYKYHRVKNGCWSYLAEYLCVTKRAYQKEDLHAQRNGFRICRTY